MTRLLILLPLLIVAGLSALFFVRLESGINPSEIKSVLIGKPAPRLALAALGPTPSFGPAELADGQVKVVNFWASWCAPCRIEHPLLSALKGRVDLYGVAMKDKPDNALGFLDELGNPFDRIGVDPDGRAAIEWGVYGVPETFVVDGTGTIVLKHVGPLDEAAIAEEILPAVEKARNGS